MNPISPPKIVAIIQARQGSVRLPGKVMMKVLEKPLLSYLIERVKRAKLLDEIVVATTVLANDDVIEQFCNENNILCFRGSDEDVLERYLAAAQMVSANAIVRMTADCPLIAPEVIDQVLKHYLSRYPAVDYVSNTLERTYPRGMDVEVFSYQCLKRAADYATKMSDREHVTSFIYQHPNEFTLDSVVGNNNYSGYRWTVDTPEDFELVSRLITTLYVQNPQFTFQDLLCVMQQHPDWALINAHIQQR